MPQKELLEHQQMIESKLIDLFSDFPNKKKT